MARVGQGALVAAQGILPEFCTTLSSVITEVHIAAHILECDISSQLYIELERRVGTTLSDASVCELTTVRERLVDPVGGASGRILDRNHFRC